MKIFRTVMVIIACLSLVFPLPVVADEGDTVVGIIRLIGKTVGAVNKLTKDTKEKKDIEITEHWKNFDFGDNQVEIYKANVRGTEGAFICAKNSVTKKIISSVIADPGDMKDVGAAVNGSKADGEKFLIWLFGNHANPKIDLSVKNIR